MTAVAALMLMSRPGFAGPTGGTVVQGSAGIQQSGTTTNINQSTNKAIINWQGFSINSSETVNFNQPNVSSVTLNRVIGNEASVINGALNANGQVFIVNSAGVLFGKGAQVNVGGIVASTLDITNQNFMAGNYAFSGNSSASVINRGKIHAADGGYVSLLGKTVANNGVIVANLGTVAMASGQQTTLNFGGNSLVDVTIDKGTLNALVSNKRAIIANGGQVILTAKAADEVLSAQVNNSGVIQARTMAALTGGGAGTQTASRKGSIRLLAQGGTVKVSGKLDASAPKGGDGGFIETSGNKVNIADSATITTLAPSGKSGTWLIDPDGYTIAASGGDTTGAALSSRLATNGTVIIASTDGNGTDGNINVNDTVSWASDAILSLNATQNININAPITARCCWFDAECGPRHQYQQRGQFLRGQRNTGDELWWL
jgi:filamentous hemagglutinin family protein